MLKGIVSVVSDSAETVGNFYLGIGKSVVKGLEGIGESIGEFSAKVAHKNIKEEEIVEDTSLLIKIDVEGLSYKSSHYFRGDLDCDKSLVEYYDELNSNGGIIRLQVLKGKVDEVFPLIKELEKHVGIRFMIRSEGILEIPEA